jgi:hypothetical protein
MCMAIENRVMHDVCAGYLESSESSRTYVCPKIVSAPIAETGGSRLLRRGIRHSEC